MAIETSGVHAYSYRSRNRSTGRHQKVWSSEPTRILRKNVYTYVVYPAPAKKNCIRHKGPRCIVARNMCTAARVGCGMVFAVRARAGRHFVEFNVPLFIVFCVG